MNPKVIALIGQAGSGKTTIAEHLELQHHYVRVRFAGILKAMLFELGLTLEEIDGALKEKPCPLLLGKTPRYAMQTLGIEWGRHLIHPDLWAHAWKVKVTEQLNLGHRVVCDDCRFENETNSVRSFQRAQIWSVWRLERDLPKRMDHESEKEFDKLRADKTFSNFGSIRDLQVTVDQILRGD